jgi:MFS family permease
MVSGFFHQLPIDQLGNYAGILVRPMPLLPLLSMWCVSCMLINIDLQAGSFNFGGLLGSVMWGMLSDSLGRRPVMLLGILGTFFRSVYVLRALVSPLILLQHPDVRLQPHLLVGRDGSAHLGVSQRQHRRGQKLSR